MPPKPYLPQSADSLMHPDARLEPSEQDEADRKMVSAKEVRERYSNLETRVDLAKGEADEAKQVAAEALAEIKALRVDFSAARNDDAQETRAFRTEVKTAIKGLTDAIAAVANSTEERFMMLFTDTATNMGSGIRIEKGLDALKAQNLVIDDRLTTTIVKVERLTGETDSVQDKIRASHDSIRTLANDVRSTQTRLAEKAAADKMDRVRMEERFATMKSDISELKKDVSESGQHAAVGEAFARRSLDSVDEIKGIVVEEKREERTETREVKKETREDKRHLWKWALGVFGAALLTLAATLISAHYGAQNVPHLPPTGGH